MSTEPTGLDLARHLAAQGTLVATATMIDGPYAGIRLVVTADQLHGTTGDPALDQTISETARAQLITEQSATTEISGTQVFIDVYPPTPKLIVIGAVHIAQALVTLARDFGFERIVIDPRPTLANTERFPDVERIVIAWPDDGLTQIAVSPRDAIAVLTHDPKFDEPALVAAIKTPAGYIGAVGSRKTSVERQDRLKGNGLTDQDIARIHGPIGLNIGGKTPPEMALSILAEIIATRYDRPGGSLVAAAGNIRG